MALSGCTSLKEITHAHVSTEGKKTTTFHRLLLLGPQLPRPPAAASPRGCAADPVVEPPRIPIAVAAASPSPGGAPTPARPSRPPRRRSIRGSPSPDWASSQYSERSAILLRSKLAHHTLQFCCVTLFIRAGRREHLIPLVKELPRSRERLDIVVIRADSTGYYVS
ncbi:hypothetical protein PVAP13_7KG391400 [Panicum virgatum]|uniref:DUF569 domain-containing protein n=1 Tax=Panicum virgatum TaxID=38727 RepID=A0A8T0QN42_PANVG|nr:hypothetical protein PVAP13_7KG391400 [Panicum virgatum]